MDVCALADGMVIRPDLRKSLQDNVNLFEKELVKFNLKLNKDKIKEMTMARTQQTLDIQIGNAPIEQVNTHHMPAR